MGKTSDIGVAAAFASMGLKLENVEYNGSRASFIFEDDEACRIFEHLYYDGKLNIDAKRFHEQYRRLMTYTRRQE